MQWLALLLPLQVPERVVLRATVFTIVLGLAAAPPVSLLCKVWCYPSDSQTGACHHHQRSMSLSVNGDDPCSAAALNALSFIREDGPRAATESDAAQAVPVPRYRLVRPSSELRMVASSANPSRLETRPLETALRL
jgi:hypothetical protein